MVVDCGGLSGDSLPLLYGDLVLWFVFDWFVLCFSLVVSDGFATALRLGFCLLDWFTLFKLVVV